MSEKINKTKIIVILGPTASGKSDIAVFLAKKFNGEIISADSRQVYKKLNIGTGKITKREMRGVPHYLLDVVSAKKRFTASDFKKLAEKAIEKIIKNKKIPIICGGTGFYIDILLGEKQIPKVPPNEKLRKNLEKKNVEELFKMLKKLDPTRAKNIDSKNPRRLIRAIEICKTLGSVPKFKDESLEMRNRKYDVLKIGITPQKKITHPNPSLTLREGQEGEKYILNEHELKNRINKRIEKWFKEGLLKEVKDLHKKGLSWKRMSELGLEYKIVANFLREPLRKKVSRVPLDTLQLKKEMVKKMQIETWQYAKRQIVWFKRDKNIIWFPAKINLIEKEIKKFLKE